MLKTLKAQSLLVCVCVLKTLSSLLLLSLTSLSLTFVTFNLIKIHKFVLRNLNLRKMGSRKKHVKIEFEGDDGGSTSGINDFEFT